MSQRAASDTRSIIEIGGLIAVVLGLLFVGIEVRQNTAAMQAATLQGLNDSSQEYLLTVASNSELVDLQLRAVLEPDSLSDVEARQYFLLERTRWLRSQNAFNQYQRGTLSEDDWVTYEIVMCDRKSSSWQVHKSVVTQKLVEFVESTCNW